MIVNVAPINNVRKVKGGTYLNPWHTFKVSLTRYRGRGSSQCKRRYDMKTCKRNLVICSVAVFLGIGGVGSAGETSPDETIGAEGVYVRLAENSEAYVIVGFRTANESVGDEWMILNVGMTLQQGVETQTISRDQIKVVTPDDQVLSMATQEEFEKAQGTLITLEKSDVMEQSNVHDNINYFPSTANQPCRIEFFIDPTHFRKGKSYDEFHLSTTEACIGRMFFRIPDGIKHGTYNLDVKFAESIIKVPIQIMTKDEIREAEKEWKQQLKESRHHNHDHH